VVFVTLPSAEPYAFIGDVTWQMEGITKRVERPMPFRMPADSDPKQVRMGLLRVIALRHVLRIVPAHDSRAFDTIPLLQEGTRPA
jgi:hypothetical protein